ncbi:MAG: LysR family transcriptional regulator [Bdellovibrionales bacterium]|nr:LysR family transcriptional regulator [Bdellovibrionales bacterium]
MALQTHQLEAFVAIAKTKNFSKAAETLHVTQSALSHRISALEEEIGAPLFIRERTGVSLTELGVDLLQYVKLKDSLEGELLSRIQDPKSKKIKGVLRVGCYASIGRSVVLQALMSFLTAHPHVQLFFMVREMKDLPELLKSGEADAVFMDYDDARGKVKSEMLGEEEFALVESKLGCANPDLYLNHDEHDMITFRFYELQGQKNKVFQRSYLDEIYSCIDGVANGIGRSVLPIHLVKSHPGIKINTGFKNLRMPVYLHYYEQPVVSELMKKVLEHFKKEIPKVLS